MLNIFNIPLRLINQIQQNPYYGAGFFAFIFIHIIVLSFLQLYLGYASLSLISESYAFASFLFIGVLTFTSSYALACVLDHFITKNQIDRAFHSSCTGFITTLFFVYSLDNKMKLSFRKQVLFFEIDETKLSASNRHKFKEYQILSKYLSSQHFYKALDDADSSLILQWREQCRRFEGKDGDLSAHWIQSTEELLKILLPHKENILEIAKNIEFYKSKQNDGAQLILQKIKESFDQIASK